MDLNRLYFQHQISLMRVADAGDARSRDRQQSLADGFARSIARFGQGMGRDSAATCCAGGGL